MVSHPGAPASPGTLRPLNAPEPVAVTEGPGGVPLSLSLGGRKWRVTSIQDCWEIEDEWWREVPVARSYYEVLLEDGRPVTLFRDKAGGRWFRQRA